MKGFRMKHLWSLFFFFLGKCRRNMLLLHKTQQNGPSKPRLENTLCSGVRLRILKLLAESQKLTTSEIAAEERVNCILTHPHLEAPEKSDILTYANFGKRICHYGFKESAGANPARNFVKAWLYPENSARIRLEEISEGLKDS
jgi:hypothetical protein